MKKKRRFCEWYITFYHRRAGHLNHDRHAKTDDTWVYWSVHEPEFFSCSLIHLEHVQRGMDFRGKIALRVSRGLDFLLGNEVRRAWIRWWGFTRNILYVIWRGFWASRWCHGVRGNGREVTLICWRALWAMLLTLDSSHIDYSDTSLPKRSKIIDSSIGMHWSMHKASVENCIETVMEIGR